MKYRAERYLLVTVLVLLPRAVVNGHDFHGDATGSTRDTDGSAGRVVLHSPLVSVSLGGTVGLVGVVVGSQLATDQEVTVRDILGELVVPTTTVSEDLNRPAITGTLLGVVLAATHGLELEPLQGLGIGSRAITVARSKEDTLSSFVMGPVLVIASLPSPRDGVTRGDSGDTLALTGVPSTDEFPVALVRFESMHNKG